MPTLADRFNQTRLDLSQAIADAFQRLQVTGEDALDDIKDNAEEFKGAIERIWSAALADPGVPVQEVVDEGTNSGASDVSHPEQPVVPSPGADETEDYVNHNESPAKDGETPQDEDDSDVEDGDTRTPEQKATEKTGGEPTQQTGDEDTRREL